MFHSVNTYTPSDVFLVIGGISVEGWNTISVLRQIQENRFIQGIRGKNTRVRNKNSHASIEVSLDMTSNTNRIFTEIVALDQETGAGRLEISLVDKSGTEVFSSNQAYIQGTAKRDYDSSNSPRVWVIECLTSRFSDGGGSTITENVFDMLGNIFN